MASVSVVKSRPGNFPTWFQPKPGFKFRDSDGDPCLVVGWGGWRDTEHTSADTPFGCLNGYRIVMKPCDLIIAVLYKGEWSVRNIKADMFGDLAAPGWSTDQLAERSDWL